jgi:hypothetical protein
MTLRGDYERTVDTYLKEFGSSQILVCFYDAIERDPVGLLAGVTAFLGIAPVGRGGIDGETRLNPSPERGSLPHRSRTARAIATTTTRTRRVDRRPAPELRRALDMPTVSAEGRRVRHLSTREGPEGREPPVKNRRNHHHGEGIHRHLAQVFQNHGIGIHGKLGTVLLGPGPYRENHQRRLCQHGLSLRPGEMAKKGPSTLFGRGGSHSLGRPGGPRKE